MSAPYVCRSCCERLAISGRTVNSQSQLIRQKGFYAVGQRSQALHTSVRNSASQTATTPSRRPDEFQNNATAVAAAAAASGADKFPKTSEMQKVIRQEAAKPKDGPFMWLARLLRKNASAATETYAAYGACEKMVNECARQADYVIPKADKNADLPKTPAGEDLGYGEGWWYSHLGLTPTFNTWAQITFLHMYALTCRIRMLPPELAPIWHQHLINQFFYKAEERMTIQHAIVASSHRSKYLKDLFVQWRGLTARYDEALMKGDAVLATAIWRNIFRGEDDVDMVKVAEVVSYMRAMLRGFESVPYENIESGSILFNDPASGKSAIGIKRAEAVVLPTDAQLNN